MVLDVGILIFDEVELLDFAGPLEVFYAARPSPLETEVQLFNAFTIARSKDPVKVKGGLRILPDKTFDEVESVDILVIPGGRGARKMKGSEPEIQFVRSLEPKTEHIATVCTGTWIYALSGSRKGEKVVTHHLRREEFKKRFPEIEIVEGYRYFENDTIVSAGGVSCGIDLALYLVYKFFGEEAADYTASVLEYPFNP